MKSNTDEYGHINIADLETTAQDLLQIKRQVQEEEKKEITKDISNIDKADSYDEMLFKMYEQIKNFNNVLSTLQKVQKEYKMDMSKISM